MAKNEVTYEVSSLDEVAHHFDRLAKECRDRLRPLNDKNLPVSLEDRLLARQATTWTAAAAFIRRVRILSPLTPGWVDDPQPGHQFRHRAMLDDHSNPLRFTVTSVDRGLVYFTPVGGGPTLCSIKQAFKNYVHEEDCK